MFFPISKIYLNNWWWHHQGEQYCSIVKDLWSFLGWAHDKHFCRCRQLEEGVEACVVVWWDVWNCLQQGLLHLDYLFCVDFTFSIDQACDISNLTSFFYLKLLKRSEELCKSSLQEDEDVEEDDIDRETGIIRVQLAYAIQMQVEWPNCWSLKPVNLELSLSLERTSENNYCHWT